MGLGGGPVEAGVHTDEFCPTVQGPGYPFEGYRMICCCVGTHHQDAIGIPDVDPVIRHRASSERLCQSRNRSAVLDTGLMFNIYQSQSAHNTLKQPTFLIIQSS